MKIRSSIYGSNVWAAMFFSMLSLHINHHGSRYVYQLTARAIARGRGGYHCVHGTMDTIYYIIALMMGFTVCPSCFLCECMPFTLLFE